MPVKVKICGVRTPAIVEVAAGEGADYIGLVFFAKSPRSVTLAEAKALAKLARGKVATMAVLVDPDDALIGAVMDDVNPDMLQLHGSETPERVAAIGAKTSRPLMKAVRIAGEQDVASAAPYAECASYVLFDAKAPSGATIPGGNGVAFDWRALKNVRVPFALSG
ncbi:MAG TPA: phosphoribosylanthranilate isomerase, partial [Methyloceanibacter sp.]|nr:phosphoribosylanthranilate isomerase [Methyloceanibacter sp.]